MSDPSSSVVPASFRPPRLIRLVLLGVILTPVAAIIGAIAAPGTFAIWIFAVLTFLVTQQWNASGAMLAAPLIYAAVWACPTTCVVLPVVATLMRGNSTRLALLVVIAAAAVAALASGYVMTTWIYPVELTSPAAVMIADLVAGAVIGALFWLALRRMDRARSRNQSAD